MKKILYISFSLLILSCNDDSSKKDSHKKLLNKFEKDTLETTKSTITDSPLGLLWEYQFDKRINDFKIVRVRFFDKDSLTAVKLEQITNKAWNDIQIKYLKTDNDTVFITIPNSEILTQQMGTAGANEFMISTTFSFTELEGINYVSYDFEYGDHAMPGTYNRKSWEELKK